MSFSTSQSHRFLRAQAISKAMIKVRDYGPNLFLFVLEIVFAAGTLCARVDLPASTDLPAILDAKLAKRLITMRPMPEYPPVARVNYIEGHVRLMLTVDAKGEVERVHVVAGDPILAESAVIATRGWTYRPLSTASGPSGFTSVLSFDFTLQFRYEELTPREAERDFLRQVKPPQVVPRTEALHPGDALHMRLLIDDKGKLLDWAGAPKSKGELVGACETLQSWTFRPAHWGNLPVASYLDVEVPVRPRSIARVAADSHNP